MYVFVWHPVGYVNCMHESAVPTLAGCPFFFFVQALGGLLASRHKIPLELLGTEISCSTVKVCMVIVSVFHGSGAVFVDAILDQRSSSLYVVGMNYSRIDPPGLVLGERWLVALLASRHLFYVAGWCNTCV